MSPYNASSYSPSRLSTYVPSSSKYSSGYSSLSSSSYKPPAYSSPLSSKYVSSTYSSYSSPRSYSSYSSPSKYLTYSSPRTYSSYSPQSSYLGLPKTRSSSVRYIPEERQYLSSALAQRPSLPSYTPTSETSSSYRKSSWCDSISDDEDDKPGLRVGLNNLGNTCFMNAVLQCLCHTPPLMDYCTRGSYVSDVNHRSQTHGDLMKVFAAFMQKVATSKSKSAISPYQLRREVQRYSPRFCGDSQQDSQEFLRYLLQGLHDDINRVKYKSIATKRDDVGSDAQSAWRKYRETDDSLIVDLFGGQLKSTLKCTVCNNESITYDPFWDISLPIPENSRNNTLRQCFHSFSSPEILDGPNKPLCEVCRTKTRSSKKIEINKLPKVLVIHLKRFSGTCYGQKLNTMVDCPMKLGNINELVASNFIGDGSSYILYGVVDHDGSNNSGHYTAKCRSPLNKEWSEFNDSRVSKVSNIVTYKTYILFYIQEGRFSI